MLNTDDECSKYLMTDKISLEKTKHFKETVQKCV